MTTQHIVEQAEITLKWIRSRLELAEDALADNACHLHMEAAAIDCRAAAERGEPFAIYRPRLFPDGDMWCALYGDNLQEGVAGFGKSPYEAVASFNAAWVTPLEMQERNKLCDKCGFQVGENHEYTCGRTSREA